MFTARLFGGIWRIGVSAFWRMQSINIQRRHIVSALQAYRSDLSVVGVSNVQFTIQLAQTTRLRELTVRAVCFPWLSGPGK